MANFYQPREQIIFNDPAAMHSTPPTKKNPRPQALHSPSAPVSLLRPHSVYKSQHARFHCSQLKTPIQMVQEEEPELRGLSKYKTMRLDMSPDARTEDGEVDPGGLVLQLLEVELKAKKSKVEGTAVCLVKSVAPETQAMAWLDGLACPSKARQNLYTPQSPSPSQPAATYYSLWHPLPQPVTHYHQSLQPGPRAHFVQGYLANLDCLFYCVERRLFVHSPVGPASGRNGIGDTCHEYQLQWIMYDIVETRIRVGELLKSINREKVGKFNHEYENEVVVVMCHPYSVELYSVNAQKSGGADQLTKLDLRYRLDDCAQPSSICITGDALYYLNDSGQLCGLSLATASINKPKQVLTPVSTRSPPRCAPQSPELPLPAYLKHKVQSLLLTPSQWIASLSARTCTRRTAHNLTISGDGRLLAYAEEVGAVGALGRYAQEGGAWVRVVNLDGGTEVGSSVSTVPIGEDESILGVSFVDNCTVNVLVKNRHSGQLSLLAHTPTPRSTVRTTLPHTASAASLTSRQLLLKQGSSLYHADHQHQLSLKLRQTRSALQQHIHTNNNGNIITIATDQGYTRYVMIGARDRIYTLVREGRGGLRQLLAGVRQLSGGGLRGLHEAVQVLMGLGVEQEKHAKFVKQERGYVVVYTEEVASEVGERSLQLLEYMAENLRQACEMWNINKQVSLEQVRQVIAAHPQIAEVQPNQQSEQHVAPECTITHLLKYCLCAKFSQLLSPLWHAPLNSLSPPVLTSLLAPLDSLVSLSLSLRLPLLHTADHSPLSTLANSTAQPCSPGHSRPTIRNIRCAYEGARRQEQFVGRVMQYLTMLAIVLGRHSGHKTFRQGLLQDSAAWGQHLFRQFAQDYEPGLLQQWEKIIPYYLHAIDLQVDTDLLQRQPYFWLTLYEEIAPINNPTKLIKHLQDRLQGLRLVTAAEALGGGGCGRLLVPGYFADYLDTKKVRVADIGVVFEGGLPAEGVSRGRQIEKQQVVEVEQIRPNEETCVATVDKAPRTRRLKNTLVSGEVSQLVNNEQKQAKHSEKADQLKYFIPSTQSQMIDQERMPNSEAGIELSSVIPKTNKL